jgi:alpha-tubulin suppressor-like RCC1 family protein
LSRLCEYVLWCSLAVLVGSCSSSSVNPGERATDKEQASLTYEAASYIVAGGLHVCVIVDGGQVKCWGSNASGELGLGDANARGVAPSQMGNGLPTVFLGVGRYAVQLALGNGHTCALLDTGDVKCWGDNTFGQLGRDNTASVGTQPTDMQNLTPVNLGAGRHATAIAAGGYHTCAILDNSQLKCWGYNNFGQLGLAVGNGQGPNSPHGRSSYGTTSGDMAALPAIDLGPGRTANQLALGNGHSCARLDNGNVVCWGDEEDGALGLGIANVGSNSHVNDIGDDANEMGTNLRPVSLGTGLTVRAIAAGTSHNCASFTNNQMKCWGNNTSGALGINQDLSRGNHSGDMGDNLPFVALGGRTVISFSLGGYVTCALVNVGVGQPNQVECWGSASNGILGTGDFRSRGSSSQPMDGTTVRFGVPGCDDHGCVSSVSMNSGHACAALSNGWIKCWGENGGGQLGDGDTQSRGGAPQDMGQNLPYVDLGSRPVTQVVAGLNHTCVSTAFEGGGLAVRCWGANDQGQLGLGDTTSRGNVAGQMSTALAPVDLGSPYGPQLLASGAQHMCALSAGVLKCWGRNDMGQLGVGDRNNRGDNANEMGTNLPAINLGTSHFATAVTAGIQHTCALLETGQVKCWGYSDAGELGTGGFAELGDGPGEMGDALPVVNLGTGQTAKAIAAGGFHTCAILANNQVKCWGYNGFGQLGLGDKNSRGDNAGEMGDALPTVFLGTGRTAKAIGAGIWFSCALLDDNSVKCWGYNGDGELGQGNTVNRGDDPGEMNSLLPIQLGTGRSAKSIAVGGYEACAVLDNNQLKCWGYFAGGELGQGDAISHGANAGDMGDNLHPIDLGSGHWALSVAAANYGMHTCAVLEDFQVKCWGSNTYGELGLGDTVARGNWPNQMGNALPLVDLGPDHPATGCADGTIEQVFSNLAVGCAGAVLDVSRASLCAAGSRPCSAAEWMAVRGGAVPTHNYWTDDQLVYGGAGSNLCMVSTTTGIACTTGQPMRVCTAGGSDPEGNICNWANCGYGSTAPNQYFGGCNGDTTAGTLCCPAQPTTFAAISGGSDHACAVMTDGTATCWGDNSRGDLGRGDSVTQKLPPAPVVDANLAKLHGVKAITAGVSSSCAVLSAGTVDCWGANAAGSGIDSNVALPVAGVSGAVAVSSAGDQTCALLSSGGVTCWTSTQAPTAVAGLTSATAITVGGTWACALMSNRHVQCWGTDEFGEFGEGPPGFRTQAPTDVPGVLDAVALSGTSGGHVCAVRAGGGVYCWGRNTAGEIGDGSTPAYQIVGPTTVVDSLGPPAHPLSGAVGIVAGLRGHTCAVLSNGTIECWGDNSYGQLGNYGGALLYPQATAAVSGITKATSVGAGENFACAVLSDGSAFCWGFDGDATLGDGSGSNLPAEHTPVSVRF